jgi:hypothetical protein
VSADKEPRAKIPPHFNAAAAHGLAELVEKVFSHHHRLEAFRKDPAKTAADAGADISDVPEHLIKTLAALSSSELKLLAELNKTLPKEGLFVELENPGPLFVL